MDVEVEATISGFEANMARNPGEAVDIVRHALRTAVAAERARLDASLRSLGDDDTLTVVGKVRAVLHKGAKP